MCWLHYCTELKHGPFTMWKLKDCQHVMRHLRSIMGISLRDKITNVEVLRRAGRPSLISILIETNLRWLGHIERMDHQCLSRQLLYSQLKTGGRNHAYHWKTKWCDQLRNILLIICAKFQLNTWYNAGDMCNRKFNQQHTSKSLGYVGISSESTNNQSAVLVFIIFNVNVLLEILAD